MKKKQIDWYEEIMNDICIVLITGTIAFGIIIIGLYLASPIKGG